MKKVLFWLPVIILITIVTIGLLALYNNDKKSISIKLENGQEVILPEFSLPELYNQDKTFSRNDLIGENQKKYSLINIFASWCVNCAFEHNLLMELSKRNDINIYGIAWRDIDENTKKYLEENGNPYLKVGTDGKGIFSKLLSVSGTPETFIINNSGQIIYYQKGPLDKAILTFLNK